MATIFAFVTLQLQTFKEMSMAKGKPKKSNTKNKQALTPNYSQANFIQRLGAYLVDIIIVAVLLIVATTAAVLLVFIGDKTGLVNLNAYQGISDYLANNLLFAAYLAGIIIAYYGYFWCKVGQTPGMKICHLRIQNSDGSNISFTQSLIRMATSAFGLGNFLALFSEKQAFQDTWAECEVIVVAAN
jgi:uncharacterized RDD family membrane protein YckC